MNQSNPRWSIKICLQIEENGSEIRRISGSSIPESCVSSGSSITLVFRSDGSVTDTGFQLRYYTSKHIVIILYRLLCCSHKLT